jgi:hypothetical protein
LDIGLAADDPTVKSLDLKIQQASDATPSEPQPPKRKPPLEILISRVMRLRDQQIKELETTHELFEAVESYIHAALRRVEQIQARGNAQAAKLKRLNTFTPSDLGGVFGRTLSLPGLGAGLGRDMLA